MTTLLATALMALLATENSAAGLSYSSSISLRPVGLEIDEDLWNEFDRRSLRMRAGLAVAASGGPYRAQAVAHSVWYITDGLDKRVTASRLARAIGDDVLMNEIRGQRRKRKTVGWTLAGVGTAATIGGVVWFSRSLSGLSMEDYRPGGFLASTLLPSIGIPLACWGFWLALTPGQTETLSSYRSRREGERMVDRYNVKLAEELGIKLEQREIPRRPAPIQVRLVPRGLVIAGSF